MWIKLWSESSLSDQEIQYSVKFKAKHFTRKCSFLKKAEAGGSERQRLLKFISNPPTPGPHLTSQILTVFFVSIGKMVHAFSVALVSIFISLNPEEQNNDSF